MTLLTRPGPNPSNEAQARARYSRRLSRARGIGTDMER